MGWAIGKVPGVPFRLEVKTINKFRVLLDQLGAIAVEKGVKEFFSKTSHYKSMLGLISQIKKELNSLTGDDERASLEKHKELEKLFMLIKTLEDLVVKNEAQIKGLNPKYFMQHYQEATPLVFKLQQLIDEYRLVLQEILGEEHDFIVHLQGIYGATKTMEELYIETEKRNAA